MIIKKGTKHPIVRSDLPNENWTKDNDYLVIDDKSELGKKILEYAPYYEEITNENGDLIDITPTERPPTPPREKTELETLQEKVNMQDQVIEELMFSIIPSLGGN